MVAHPPREASGAEISEDELRLATRNHGTPLEALTHEITPLGLHYLLIHYDIPTVSPLDWRLSIGGRVRRELELSLEDLRSRPARTVAVTMECAGNGRAHMSPRPLSQPWLVEAVGTAEWTGVPLASVLGEAQPDDDVVEVVFTGLDRGVENGVEQVYERSLPLQEAQEGEALLAYRVNGRPLPPQHGFPLRLIVPGWYGMTNVKWLQRITAVSKPFAGYQQTRGYHMRQTDDEEGIALTRMAPRALMIPPGVPDFMTRQRYLPPEPCELRGRAWSGWGPIDRVQVSADGGATWADAQLAEQSGPAAWRAWTWLWQPHSRGTFELCCRAHDAAGNKQPLDPIWNLGGYANNAVQRIVVHVGEPPSNA